MFVSGFSGVSLYKTAFVGTCICGEMGVEGVDWIGLGCVCMKDISFA